MSKANDNNNLGNGTIANVNDTVIADTSGNSTVLFNITGTWVGTLQVEGLDSQGISFGITGYLLPSAGAFSGITGNFPVVVNCGGYQQVRIRASAFTSGTANIAWSTGQGNNIVSVFSANAASFNATIKNTDEPIVAGVYFYSPTAQTVQASADAATAGRFWIINPIGNTKTVRIKAIQFTSQLGSALLTPTSPRITVERVTFTGIASGATVAGAKRKTADPAPVSVCITASTGIVLSAGNIIKTFLPIACATAVGFASADLNTFIPDINNRLDLVAGEGIVIRQPDAGTASDSRRYILNFIIEEF
ncbi:MAG TPA: hypothetical protein VN855_00165 [Candidatus Acidoferrum sp.]|nr:hypothetical protein [Candidatus Acidoferrum sp.]